LLRPPPPLEEDEDEVPVEDEVDEGLPTAGRAVKEAVVLDVAAVELARRALVPALAPEQITFSDESELVLALMQVPTAGARRSLLVHMISSKRYTKR